MKLEIKEIEKLETTPTICLSMIVKNESRIITRLLDSVISIIDTYCICDTGSTDDTIKVIKDYFDTRCMRGKITEEPFKNFGHNRNVAIEAAKGLADYLLFLDADMVLNVSPEFDKASLTAPVYSLQQGSNTFKYFNVRLVRSELPVKCVGATHEYYDHPHSPVQLATLSINDIGDGGCKGNKFNRDIELLEQDLAENPKNGRTHFYLANSYKNLGNYATAIEHYQKRIEIGGWIEEVWYSHYMVGDCYSELGEPEKALYWWLKAYGFYPQRAETIYQIVKHFRIKGDHEVAYLFYKIGKEIPFPHSNVLFIHKDVYDYLFDYELSIIAYYLKNYSGDKRVPFMKLLNTNHSLDNNHIISNYKFYSKSVKEFCTKEINLSKMMTDFDRNKHYVASSPSIIPHNSGYLLNVRYVNYHIEPNGCYTYRDGYNVCTNNVRAVMDPSFNIDSCEVWENDHVPTRRIRGIEDLKIIKNGQMIHFIGTSESDKRRPDDNYCLTMVAGEYDLSANKLNPHVVDSPHSRQCEKNWALFSHEGELKTIYEWSPLTIGTHKGGKLVITEEKEAPPILQRLRGSSNGCEFGNEIWFMVHAVEYSQPRSYYHCLVTLDAQTLEYKRHSKLFTFDGDKIEFCLGLIVEAERIIVTHSNWDRTAKLKILDKKRLFADIGLT